MAAVHLAGVGQLPSGRHPRESLSELGVRAARLALADAEMEYA